MRLLPKSTINDNKTILQEILIVRKYLEENPCRNIFEIGVDFDDSIVAYDITKIEYPEDFDGEVYGGDVLLFKNAYLAVVSTTSEDYVVIKADTGISIKGDKGDTGETGATGQNGVSITGVAKTGTSGLVDTYTITFSNGTTSTFTVTNGQNGTNGTNGTNGQDGVGIVSVTKTSSVDFVDVYTITYTNNTISTFTVTNGRGVPTGGTAGQVLKKKTGTDYDTEWGDVSGGGGSSKVIQLSDNLLINPNFRINQRGVTTNLSATGYGADRWYWSGLNSGSVKFINDDTYYKSAAVLTPSSNLGGKISQFVRLDEEYNKFSSGAYLLAIVESYIDESHAFGEPLIDIKVGNNTLTPLVDQEKRFIGTGITRKQYWVVYDLGKLGQDGVTSIPDNFEFIITGDNTKVTYVTNTGLFLLDSLPDDLANADSGVILNIPKVYNNIELEKCNFYCKLCDFNNTLIGFSGATGYMYVYYKNMRVKPTLAKGNMSVDLVSTTTLESAGTQTKYASDFTTNITSGYRAVFSNTSKYGIIGFKTVSLLLDAEIYPS